MPPLPIFSTCLYTVDIFSGLTLPALCLVGCGYVSCDRTLAVSLVFLGVGFNCLAQAGFQVNHMDIAPNYAGEKSTIQ